MNSIGDQMIVKIYLAIPFVMLGLVIVMAYVEGRKK